MSAGGLTGAGGGSLTGTTVLPGSVEPDASAIIKYNNAGQQRSASNAKQTGDSKKRGDDAKPAGDGDAKALGEQQSRKAQDFDAVYGRPPLGEQSGGKQQDKSNDESAFDVVRRADKGAAEVVYGAAGELVGTVNDAAGAVLHGAIGWTGVDIFKGHAERNQARGEGMWNTGKAAVEAAKSPVETVEKGIEIVKAEGAEIADEWQAGRYGDLAERSGQVAGVIAVGAFGGAATKVLRRSDGPDSVKGPDDTGSAAKGPDAPGGKDGTPDAGKVGDADGTGMKVGDFSNIEGASPAEILNRIPTEANVRPLHPISGAVTEGYEYSWKDGSGQTWRVRIHGPDASAPSGSNAQQGWIVRVQKGTQYMDNSGNFHPRGIHNEKSPNYNPASINDTHIPVKSPKNASEFSR